MNGRILIGGGSSGSGKTTVTCGILQALKNRGFNLTSFKCGPDYIDPMFHTKVLGVQGRNLDLFFTDEETTTYLLAKNSHQSDLAVIEGVMGYYDGIGGTTTTASSYHLAKATKTPVVLVANCKGMSVSIVPQIKGFVEYKKDSGICGVILNQISPVLYENTKRLIEEEVGVKVVGYLPVMKECKLESRHLGLVTAGEIKNLKEMMETLARQVEKTIDLDLLLKLSSGCEPLFYQKREVAKKASIKIGVAMDEAFCFYYEDNLALLREMGAEIIYFSPLYHKELPKGLDGLIIGGGYPELYGKRLEENITMRNDIKKAIEGGLPCLAECGGFMYLQEKLEGYCMVGAVLGQSKKTAGLTRFGYITLTANKDTMLCKKGEVICGHEFHYYDSTQNGDAFFAQKPKRNTTWQCIVAENNLFCGYPHLYFYSNIHQAENFVARCEGRKK